MDLSNENTDKQALTMTACCQGSVIILARLMRNDHTQFDGSDEDQMQFLDVAHLLSSRPFLSNGSCCGISRSSVFLLLVYIH